MRKKRNAEILIAVLLNVNMIGIEMYKQLLLHTIGISYGVDKIKKCMG